MLFSSDFIAAWWLRNRHLQTMWGALLAGISKSPQMTRWQLELPDGDFLDVDVCGDSQQPVILILHGLEGSMDSHYMKMLVTQLAAENKRVVVMYFRGCGGKPNRLLKSYHSGVSDDLQTVIQLLARRQVKVEYLVGFSLGGNVLLKWLGENHQKHQVKAAVAVSVPLMLNECANAIDTGFSRLYSKRLLKTLKFKALQKKQKFPTRFNLSNKQINHLKTFWEFDQKVTAPLHGFSSAQDYYRKVSSRQFLKSINIPTLILHAKDDPFMNINVLPSEAELAACVHFELSEQGGHVGFIGGKWPWCPKYYLQARIPEFIAQY